MYKNFEEAKAAALNVIERNYNGDKMHCVITETKPTPRTNRRIWGFHFNDTDTNGEFVKTENGAYERRYAI